MRKIYCLLVAVLFTTILVSCVGNPPSDKVNEFYNYIINGKFKESVKCMYFTEKMSARDKERLYDELLDINEYVKEIQIIDEKTEKVDNEYYATVEYAEVEKGGLERDTASIDLIKVEEQWYILMW